MKGLPFSHGLFLQQQSGAPAAAAAPTQQPAISAPRASKEGSHFSPDPQPPRALQAPPAPVQGAQAPELPGQSGQTQGGARGPPPPPPTRGSGSPPR